MEQAKYAGWSNHFMAESMLGMSGIMSLMPNSKFITTNAYFLIHTLIFDRLMAISEF